MRVETSFAIQSPTKIHTQPPNHPQKLWNIGNAQNRVFYVPGVQKRRTIGAKGNNLLQDKYCMTNYKANIKSARNNILQFTICQSSYCFLVLSVNACESKAPCKMIIIIQSFSI